MIYVDGIRITHTPRAYIRDASLATAKLLSAFTGYTATKVNAVLIQAETQDVRVTWDGTTTPTATIGTLVKAGGEGLFIICDPSKVQMIQTTASAAATVTLFQV